VINLSKQRRPRKSFEVQYVPKRRKGVMFPQHPPPLSLEASIRSRVANSRRRKNAPKITLAGDPEAAV
jgi:hypothetical protein